MPFANHPFPLPGAQPLTQGSKVAMNKADMANQLSHVDDDGIEWTEALSKDGVPFLIGVKRTEVKDHRDNLKEQSGQSLKPIKYNDDWPVGEYNVVWPVNDDSWKPTSGELSAKFISRYRLYHTLVPFFDYRLDIDAVRRGVKYTFYDESGDYYTLDAVYSGTHFVLYNSDKPTIIFVKAKVVANYPP